MDQSVLKRSRFEVFDTGWRSIIFRVVVVVAWLAPLITSHLIEWNKRRGLRWINEWTIRIKFILIPKWEAMNLDYSLLRKNPQDPCFCGFSIVSNSWKKICGRKNQAECLESLTRALSKRTAEYCGRRKMTLFLHTSSLSSVRHILFYNVLKLVNPCLKLRRIIRKILIRDPSSTPAITFFK